MAKSKEHYVNNKDFLHAIIQYKNRVEKAKETDDKKPPVGEYIGVLSKDCTALIL